MIGPRGFSGVVLIGFMGSGKTSVGREISRRMDAELVDLDDRIERSAGASVREIFAARVEPAFREMERKAVREAVSVPGRVIATGGGAFLDAGSRRMLKRYATVVFLDVSPGSVLARLPGDRSRPLLPGGGSGGDAAEREQEIGERMKRRRPAYERADLTVETDGKTVREVADLVLSGIGGRPEGGSGRDMSAGGGNRGCIRRS